MIKLLKSFFVWFLPKAKPKRRYLKDVKAGEWIVIEWSRIKTGVGLIKCLSNDTKTKTIYLEAKWNNYKEENVQQYERIILKYNDEKLENFHLLNTSIKHGTNSKPEDDNKYDIATLQKKMNEALSKEQYEYANELQKKIDKLLKK